MLLQMLLGEALTDEFLQDTIRNIAMKKITQLEEQRNALMLINEMVENECIQKQYIEVTNQLNELIKIVRT